MPSVEQLFEQAERMRRRADATLAEADLIEAKARQVQRLGEEPPVGSILTFRLRLGGNVYDYAALRAGNRWFTTGPVEARGNPEGRTWASLIEWVVNHLVSDLAVILPTTIEEDGEAPLFRRAWTGRVTRVLVSLDDSVSA